jgi:hypothetical protein
MKNKYIWRLLFYKFIGLFPYKFSQFIFFSLQKILGQVNVGRYLSSGNNFVGRIISSVEKNDFSVGIEIGTGWYPIVPLLLIKDRPTLNIFSYDLRELMSTGNYVETLQSLEMDKNTIKNHFTYKSGVDLTKYSFEEIEAERVFIFSKATLQHIPKSVIYKIHTNIIRSFPSHTIYHLINCNDHRQHTDKSLSKYEFLKYSEALWNKKHTDFDFHNRMRSTEYDLLFKELGYEIVNFTFDSPSERDLNDFRIKILPKLDNRFREFSILENTKGSLFYELKIDNK